MKRWELAELKRYAENFTRSYCSRIYKHYSSKQDIDSGSRVFLENWGEVVFTIKLKEINGIVELDYKGSNGISYNSSIPITQISSAVKGSWLFELREFILCMNDFGVVPNEVFIECSFNKVFKLVADAITYIDFKPFKF